MVLIEGHADTSGDPDYNRTLSKWRAETVEMVLAREGVPSNDIAPVEGLGEASPLIETGDGVREVQNRRVEIRYKTTSPAQ
jgi:outer membrane protein OmpA-like peptidoglycan-associated protein